LNRKVVSEVEPKMWIYLKLLLTSLFWAGTFIAGRILSRQDGPADPSSAAFLRFAAASAVMIPLIKASEKRLPKLNIRQLFAVFLLGLFGVFLYHILFLEGLKTVEASSASVLIATSPVFISILSARLFKEILTPVRFVGIILSVFGAIYVALKGDFALFFKNGIGIGQLFIIGCIACWVFYSLLGKVLLADLSPLITVSYSSVIGACLLFFPALYNGIFGKLADYAAKDWQSILYLAFFGTVAGYIWFCQGLLKIGPTRTALFINFIPIFTVILSFLILGEPVTKSLLLGTPLVVVGVYLTNKTKTDKNPK
jgi:drug/metabolite transporter (DMT)-like permease